MALEISGKVIHKLNKTEGISKAGKPWSKQEFVLEIQDGQYPRKVCLSVMNEKVNELERYNVGDTVKASLNIESREYNGKWYTDVRAWRIEGNASATPASSSENNSYQTNTPEYSADGGDQGTDDLPF